jgi:hypothetical protein
MTLHFGFFDALATALATISTVEFAGALFGVIGTLLLAFKGPRAGWGFVAFLASNLCWMTFGWKEMHRWLVVQHFVFLGTSLVGIWVWLLEERVAAKLDRLFFDPWDDAQRADDIWRRFDGRNASALAREYDMPLQDVFDIVISRSARK